jgi:hypothetical protein
LRADWPEAPAFERLLARPPTGLRLELGLRASADVTAGLQLASSDLLAGVHLALAREPVARVARRVLAVLGPRLACRRCRKPRQAVHVVRTRGLDEVHGLACPDCGAVLRSYWRYGEPEGLEALGAVALRVGLVAEQTARLGGATLAFQVPAADRERLPAGRLRALFAELYLQPCRLDLAPGLIEVRAGGKVLAASAPVPVRGVRLAPAAAAGMTDRELEASLRARIARRFRPGATG